MAGAVAGTAAGPVGTAAGLVVGAVVGGLAGKGVAEAVNPTREDAYWRENHKRQPYASNRSYDEYADAYRVGYLGYSKYSASGRSFDDYDAELREDYERSADRKLDWKDAREASRAAWSRVSGDFQRLIGYNVEDQHGHEVGTVNNVWVDENNGQPVLLGVKTGWIFGKNHVVPVSSAEANHSKRLLRLPFTEAKIKDAPSYNENAEIQDNEVREIFSYYSIETQPTSRSSSQQEEFMQSNTGGARVDQEANVKLHEERVKIGKREVESGGVRIRKIVRTETVSEPVELRREEVVIERVPTEGSADASDPTASFSEEDIFIPLRREEAVVEKQSRVREEVRVGKKTEVEHDNISETVRREDVEIENKPDRDRRL